MSAVATPKPRSASFPALPLAAAAGLGAIAFAPGAREMASRWLAPDGYYGHGPLVPAVCAWLLWRDREALGEVARSSSRAGLALVAAAVALLALSVLEDVHFTQNLALLGAVAGTALVLFGRAAVRRAWFALAFLAFMVPLPQLAIADLAFRLKMLAAALAAKAIALVGVPVVRSGSSLHLASASVTVDDACSGLRGLLAVLAIAAVFAHVERSRARAALALALAVPVAIAANVARILVLCALAAAGSRAAAEGPVHEATGLVVYAFAFLVFFALKTRPGGGDMAEGARDLPAADEPPVVHRAPPPKRVLLLLVLLAAGASVSAFGKERAALAESPRTKLVPREIGAWVGVDESLPQRVYRTLGTEDVLLRQYARPQVPGPVGLCVVHTQDAQRAHAPELCFAGEGLVRVEGDVRTIAVAGARIEANRALFRQGERTILVYYWYRLDGRDTPSHYDHWVDRLLRRVERGTSEGSLIRVSAAVDPGPRGLEAAEARIARFCAEALGPALAVLP